MSTARFITLEGGEGAGKSTQLTLLQKSFEAANLSAVTTREPGGSKGAEAIRKLVVEGAVDRWHAGSEALLFMTARYDHVETLIKPALQNGKHVLCDRFYDSTYVYQGVAKAVGVDWLDQIYSLLYGNFAPDITFYLDMPPEQGLARTLERGDSKETRFENMDISYHEALRQAFLQRAKDHPERIVVMDAAQPKEPLHHAIVDRLAKDLSLPLSYAI